MSRNLSISDTGLRLIKAFEGYRPVDRELVTGARVVGYGHRVVGTEPRRMSREQAEDTLRLDLRAYEELVNDEVHAPLSQSQFDALCSLAFNIGPKAFRESDTVRALNNGRVLDAANGFDIWRKARVDGKVYVVDALMRRRTVEKSLFLRTEKSLPAPTALLEPERDEVAALVPTDDGLPVFTEAMSAGVIAKAPYDAAPNPQRRREDNPVGILTLSEVIDPADELDDPVDVEVVDFAQPAEPQPTQTEDERAPDVEIVVEAESEPETPQLSVISDAADALGERLGALLDTEDSIDEDPSRDPADDPASDPDWPQSLIRPALPESAETPSNLVAFPARQADGPQRLTATDIASGADAFDAEPPALVIDEIAADDIMRGSREAEGPVYVAPEAADTDRPVSGLWIPVVLGFALLGASVAALVLGARALLGDWGPLMALAGSIVGALMIVFSLYLAATGSRDAA